MSRPFPSSVDPLRGGHPAVGLARGHPHLRCVNPGGPTGTGTGTMRPVTSRWPVIATRIAPVIAAGQRHRLRGNPGYRPRRLGCCGRGVGRRRGTHCGRAGGGSAGAARRTIVAGRGRAADTRGVLRHRRGPRREPAGRRPPAPDRPPRAPTGRDGEPYRQVGRDPGVVAR